MSFDTTNIRTKVQYITVDSEFVKGTNNVFTVNFMNSSNVNTSNVFVQEIRNVIGIKLVDFYVTQIASFELGITNIPDNNAIKYIDILCPDLPEQAQILDERKSKIFARIPLERDFSGSSNIVVNDKQWNSFTRQTNFFNPISIKKLNFQMWEMTGPASSVPPANGTYQLLQPDASFYMILEITTIDPNVITLPKEDPNVKVVQAIQSLEDKLVNLLEQFPEVIKASIPEPVIIKQEVPAPVAPVTEEVVEKVKEAVETPKISPKMYWIIALVLIFILYYTTSKR